MDQNHLGRALKLLRTFNDLSQSKLASTLNISSSYLSEIENGNKQPTLELIKRYGEAFGIKPSTILAFAEGEHGDWRASIQRIALRVLETISESAEEK